MKGFSKDGTFRSDSYKSYYSLSVVAGKSTDDNSVFFLQFGIFTSYILATKTLFFGKKFIENWSDLYTDENVVFMAQLITKSIGIYNTNSFGMTMKVIIVYFFKILVYLKYFVNFVFVMT